MRMWRFFLFAVLFAFSTVCIFAQQNYDSFVVHSSKPKLDWILHDVNHTDQYTVLVIDIYSLDFNENCFAFYQSSYITVNNLSGALRPVKWTINGTERPLDDSRCFPRNSNGQYIRNKLYFPRIPVGYDYFNFYMGNFIRWENIYAKNANATKQLAVTEQSLLEQWSKTGCSTIEGIYQCSKLGGETKMSRSMRLGIIYNKDIVAYEAIVLNEHDFWKVGDVIGELVPDEKEGLFVANYWRNRNKVPINSRLYAVFDINSMAIATKEASAEFVKIYPINSYGQPISNRWSGTGWALGNGYLVTNHHVAGEARSIIVKGIDGNYNTGYTAEVVATDKVNDIAILKINDSRFNGYGVLPYGVSARIADVGEDVFVLGYPLTQTMGYEIKLTNGIVSSLTGFKGDVSLYQMTAPIQPGNSGGPMFDKNGNVIGIVVSSHANAENVEYAIKTAYLKILIESAGLNIVFPNNNTISAMSLPEKVKRVKNFVYYIECSR